MRKSPSQPVRQQETRASKSAPMRGSAGRKSKPSSENGKVLTVATPTSERLRHLRELELIVPTGAPADERNVPLDLTGQSSQIVGALHSEFTARLAFVIFEAAQNESHLIELKRSLKLAKAKHLVKSDGAKKYELDAEATLDPEIKKTEDKIAELEQYNTLLEGVVAAYTKVQEGTSREMSRRGVEKTSRGD